MALIKDVKDNVESLSDKIQALSPALIKTICNMLTQGEATTDVVGAKARRDVAEQYAITADKAVGTWKLEGASTAKGASDLGVFKNDRNKSLHAVTILSQYLRPSNASGRNMAEENALKAWLELIETDIDLGEAAINLLTSRLKG
jgi:hypothetical protein